MKAATLLRQPHTDEGTFGTLKTDDGHLELCSLELPWRDLNADGVGDARRSCINAGLYECFWHLSPSRGWCYEVARVPGRSAILIHPANLAGDVEKGWQSELLGCIAFGLSTGSRPNELGKVQRALFRSRAGIEKFEQWADRQPVTLHIIEAG